MTPPSDAALLKALESDQALAVLDAYVPGLSLFRILERDRDEVAHSRMLAALFDPRSHGAADSFLRAFLGRVSASMGPDFDSTARRLDELASQNFVEVVVRRELLRIDVVIEIRSAATNAVIGIENKLYAGEQAAQLARYQDALQSAYPGRLSVLVFLTPFGRLPLTALQQSQVPCVTLG